MISVKKLTKTFGNNRAVNQISLDIPEGIMFGLLGTNGAGKTTLLRVLAGILEPDSGDILIDGKKAADSAADIFYLPDTPYYFPNATMEIMAKFYQRHYPKMDVESAFSVAETLNLDIKQPMRTFSKGMKRQAFLIIALCSGTRYLLCDEVFDGLDPIAVNIMKNLFRQEIKERKFTAVVASHKMRELEDICGSMAILHKGGLVTAGDIRTRADGMWKFQCAFRNNAANEAEAAGNMQNIRERIEKTLDIVHISSEGGFITLTARGKKEDIRLNLQNENPAVVNELPLSLEEIFIAELEVEGYDIRKVLC